MSTIPPTVLPPESATPADLVFLREPEVLTVLKEIARTQAHILALLEKTSPPDGVLLRQNDSEGDSLHDLPCADRHLGP